MASKEILGLVYVIFSVLTALTNLILITTILCTRQLRLSSKYIILLAISICDLFVGLFLYTINADLLWNDGRQYSNCNFLNAREIYVPYIHSTLRLSLIIAVMVDFLLNLMIKDVKLRYKFLLMMIACSIVGSLVLVFAMVPEGVFKTFRSGFCTIMYNDSLRELEVSAYFPQLVVLVFLGVTIQYVYSKHRTHLPNFDPANPSASPIDIIIAAACMACFQLPQVVYLITPVSNRCIECGIDMEVLFYCLKFLNYSQTFVIPLVWFAGSEMRTHIIKCQCFGPPPSEAATDIELNHRTNIN